jgi:hypothetical protein
MRLRTIEGHVISSASGVAGSSSARHSTGGAVQLSHFEKSTCLPSDSSSAVIASLAAGDVVGGVPAADPDAADDLAVDLDRPAADEDREAATVHVHDAERLLVRAGRWCRCGSAACGTPR